MHSTTATAPLTKALVTASSLKRTQHHRNFAQIAEPATPLLESLRLKMLVVDDNEFCRSFFAAILTRTGYAVETATNGADALERIAESEYDLVVTDWQMPVLDGGRMVIALRSAGIAVPVIMLSASLAEASLPTPISREVFAALEKPVSTGEFLDTIAAALRYTFPQKEIDTSSAWVSACQFRQRSPF